MADDFDSTSSVARGWRRWLPWALLTLAAVVLLAGSLTVWAKRQALSTDAWADTSEQLIQDPDTRAAVASYLVDQALARGEAAVQRLPSNLEALAPSLSASSRDAVTRAAEQLLERPAVQSLWVEANREAHRAFLDVVDGKPGRLTSRGDSLVLDLRPLVARFGGRVGLADRLPADAGLVEVATTEELTQIRRGVRAIRLGSQLLVLVAFALVAAAVWLAPGRRAAVLMNAGAKMVAVGIIDLLVRQFAGTYVAGVLAEGTVNRSVVEHGWFVGTSLLRDVAFALMAYGLLVTAAGWLAGTSRHAVAARRWVAPRLRRHPLPAGGVALAFGLAMLAWAPGGGDRRLAGTLVMCALFAVAVAALWRQSLREFPVAAEGRSAHH